MNWSAINCHTCLRLATVLAVLVGSPVYLALKSAEGYPLAVSATNSLEALKGLREWSTYLITIQGSAIAAMGFLFEKFRPTTASDGSHLTPWQETAAIATVTLFGGSMTTATWLLGAMPSIMLRIAVDKASTANDFFHFKLHTFLPFLQVGPMTGLQYGLFSLGTVTFACFVVLRISGR